MWQILIVILSLFSSGVDDSILISSYDGKPIQFKNDLDCKNYVNKNLSNLFIYSYQHYPRELGERFILCVYNDQKISI